MLFSPGTTTGRAIGGTSGRSAPPQTGAGAFTNTYTYDDFSNRSQADLAGATTTYAYDANNRLLSSAGGSTASYTYDAQGNMTQAAFTVGDTTRTLSYTYDGFNRLKKISDNGSETEYTYDVDGLRTSKTAGSASEQYVYDGDQLVVTIYTGTPSKTNTVYIRGLGLIASKEGNTPAYYHYNAHGDVVQLTTASGAVIHDYNYDAFGVEQNVAEGDTNPFRYCGEQYDAETGNYYLRARYYTPGTGRFGQEDTHWNPGNMVYGVDPQKWNEYRNWAKEDDRDDPLGLHTYTYKPEATVIAQAGNLYAYCGGNPLMYRDPTGSEWYHWVIGGLIVAVAAAAVVATAGGIVPAVYAVGAVGSGFAASSAASTIAASAFIGSSVAYGGSALVAITESTSIKSFNAKGNWGTVAFTAGGLLVGGASSGYTLYRNSAIKIAGKGSTGRVEAKNLNEQLAMKQVISDPLNGAKQLKITMRDSRWPASGGWVKMENIVHLSGGKSVNIHFVYNTRTGIFDDFKFK